MQIFGLAFNAATVILLSDMVNFNRSARGTFFRENGFASGCCLL